MTDKIIVEYSQLQGCFHIDTLSRCLEINRLNITYGRRTDYVPLMAFDNEDDAYQFVDAWRLTHCARSNRGAEEDN